MDTKQPKISIKKLAMEKERREHIGMDDPSGYDSDEDPGSEYEVDWRDVHISFPYSLSCI